MLATQSVLAIRLVRRPAGPGKTGEIVRGSVISCLIFDPKDYQHAINRKLRPKRQAVIVLLRPLLLLAVIFRTTTARSAFRQKPPTHPCDVSSVEPLRTESATPSTANSEMGLGG